MSEEPIENADVIDAGIFTRMRPFAGWLFVATIVVTFPLGVFIAGVLALILTRKHNLRPSL